MRRAAAQRTPQAVMGSDESQRDALFALWWLIASGSIAFMLSAGHPLTSASETLTTVGRVSGVVAATTIMTQLLLIARIPLVERRIGHDRAAQWHARLGRIGFLVLCAHMVLITAGYATRVRVGFLDQLWAFATDYGPEGFGAVVAFALLVVVVVTSLAALRLRWKYERWHAVHLLVYVAVLFSVPHQVELGSSFSNLGGTTADAIARIYWLTLWGGSVGAFLVFRVVVPVVRAARADLRVVSVTPVGHRSYAVVMAGPGVARLRASAGQFLLWRFISRGLWQQAHPYSLSASPDGESLRITVKAVGDGSASVASLAPGTRVVAEGPLGRFTLNHRYADNVVLVAAGSGLAPIVSLLGAVPAGARTAVILRARDSDDLPHLDEVRSMAKALGASVHILTGKRGDGWLPADFQGTLTTLAPFVAHADVYVCGPEAWTRAVEADAIAAGVPARQIHSERFAFA